MFLQHLLPLTLLSLCSFQRGLWKMIWYKQGITFLSHCSFPICSFLTAQPIIKAITQIQFCWFHSTQQSQVLLLTEMEAERDDQQARSFPGSIWILKSQKRVWRQHILLCTALLFCTVGWVRSASLTVPSPRGRKGKKGKGCGTALRSVDPRTGNATATCPFLEAVWLLMLPLKFSNFTLSFSWAVMLLLSPRNSENYYIFINHVKFSNSPSCTQSSLENNKLSFPRLGTICDSYINL